MVFAGFDPGQAADAVEEDTGDLEVSEPPPTPRMRFRSGPLAPDTMISAVFARVAHAE
jgi:hypothetical protein